MKLTPKGILGAGSIAAALMTAACGPTVEKDMVCGHDPVDSSRLFVMKPAEDPRGAPIITDIGYFVHGTGVARDGSESYNRAGAEPRIDSVNYEPVFKVGQKTLSGRVNLYSDDKGNPTHCVVSSSEFSYQVPYNQNTLANWYRDFKVFTEATLKNEDGEVALANARFFENEQADSATRSVPTPKAP